nr:hypothetical protein [Burkholderia pseudomallei]
MGTLQNAAANNPLCCRHADEREQQSVRANSETRCRRANNAVGTLTNLANNKSNAHAAKRGEQMSQRRGKANASAVGVSADDANNKLSGHAAKRTIRCRVSRATRSAR